MLRELCASYITNESLAGFENNGDGLVAKTRMTKKRTKDWALPRQGQPVFADVSRRWYDGGSAYSLPQRSAEVVTSDFMSLCALC